MLVEEFDRVGRKEFLQRPTPFKPYIPYHILYILALCKMDNANCRVLVPPKHGANRLVKLGATAFVDAAGICPSQFKPISPGLLAEALQLFVSWTCRCTYLHL